MNDEAESSGVARRHGDHLPEHSKPEDPEVGVDEEEEQKYQDRIVKERRLDAKRKRIRFLNDLLRELDLVVYMEFITLYHLDCSFFWLSVRAFIHGSLLTPISDPVGERPPDEPKPFLPLLLCSFLANFILHQTYSAPSAGEDTRGYLHGGLMIDFIGQQGPTSKWKLGALDICILLLQLVMVSVHVKRRELKTKLALISAGTSTSSAASQIPSDAATTEPSQGAAAADNVARGQDADDEERGILHRTDTLSDIGAEPDEDDALLASASDAAPVDVLDILTSGQCTVAEFSLIDTLIQENKNFRLTD